MEENTLKQKMKILLLLFFTGLLLSSCSKDSSTEPEKTEPEKTEAKPLTIKTVDVPEAMKKVSDAKASTTVAYVNLANSFNAYTALFQVPQGANSSGNTYTWSRDGLSITMYYTEESDNLSWKLVFNGTEDGTVYNNWVAMEASQSADQKNGWMKIYEENSTAVASEWTWTTDSNGQYSFIMQSKGGEGTSKIVVKSNPDKSGELNFYTNNVRTSKTTWDKDGNGQWWEYDAQGNLLNSGSWSVS